MLCKYYLMVGASIVDIDNTENCIIVSDMIKNLGEIKASYDRSELGGVVRKCASKFEFTDNARDLLIKEYRAKYLKSQAAIAIYAINNDWTYTSVFECPLDFSTFVWDNNLAHISCVDTSAAAIIKANKSTQYEYLVSDLKESSPLNYDGVKVRNEATFELTGASVEGESYSTSLVSGADYCIWIPPFFNVGENLSVNNSVKFQDQKEALSAHRVGGIEGFFGSEPNTNTSSYFIECLQDCVISLDFTNMKIWAHNAAMPGDKYNLNLIFIVYRIPLSGYPVVAMRQMPSLKGTEHDYHCSIKGDFALVKGEKLQLAINRLDLLGNTGIGLTTFYMPNIPGLAIWNCVTEPIEVDVISPNKLLNQILSSISGSVEIRGEVKETVNGEVNNRLKNTLLAASESIRGMSEAKIYSSFNKFCDFMEAEFGYVYSISPCEPSQGEMPDEYLKDFLNFDGVKEYDENDKVVMMPPDGTVVQVMYYNTNDIYSAFVGYANGVYYSLWTGSDKYQEYGEWFSVEIKNDVFFRDSKTGTYYIANKNRLIEYEIERINIKGYNAISQFGGIIHNSCNDSGIYEELINVANIFYVTSIGRFMYLNNANYYSTFEGSTLYNSESGPRKDVLFVNVNDKESYEEGQVYVPVNSDLVKYRGDVPLLIKVNEASLVTFKHRSEVFKNAVIKKIRLFSEPEYRIADDRIYSELQIGYEKQDYDNGNNGYDEFNFTNYYTTGVTVKGSTLNIICPYRADCYGFEELAEKRGSETSSTDSDTHVFLVNILADKVDGKYKLDRTVKIEGSYTDTVFNAVYAPMYMIEANSGYIGSFAKKLTFASSDGNSSIVIDNRKVRSSINVTDRMFTCGDIAIKTSDTALPSDWEGIIEFEWDGYLFRGFLKNVDANYKRNEAFEYQLIEKEQICLQ